MKETEIFPVNEVRKIEEDETVLTPIKTITIKEGGVIEWNGFANVYEILGFIDIHANPSDLKKVILEASVKK